MPRPAPDPDAIAFARERHAAGVTPERIAEEMGELGHPVSGRQLRLWLALPDAPIRAARAKAKAPAQRFQRPAPPEPPAEPLPPEDEPLLDFMRRHLRTMKVDAEQARVINPVLYQRLSRDMVILSNNIARAERDQPEDDGDSFTFARKEIDQAIPALLEKMAGWVARCEVAGGLVCSVCSRKLSVEIATGGVGSVGSDPVPRV